MANQKTPLHEFAQSNLRITGIFILLIGAVFLYFAVAEPVVNAQVGSRVYISGKGAIGSGFFTILGIILILFGRQALDSMREGFRFYNQWPLRRCWHRRNGNIQVLSLNQRLRPLVHSYAQSFITADLSRQAATVR